MIRKIALPALIFFYFFLLTQSQSKRFLLHFLLDNTIKNEKSLLILADTIQYPESYLWIDVRQANEYAVSHIPDAIIYKDSMAINKAIEENHYKKIIYYCSIGFRSGEAAEKSPFTRQGYTVYNLYGGIFDWAASGFEMLDSSGIKTHNLHPYNLLWGWFATIKGYSLQN